MRDLTKYYVEGLHAAMGIHDFRNGVIVACPYEATTAEGTAWLQGFGDAIEPCDCPNCMPSTATH